MFMSGLGGSMRIGRGGIGGDCVNLRFERASVNFACLSIGIVTARDGFIHCSATAFRCWCEDIWQHIVCIFWRWTYALAGRTEIGI